MSGIHFDVGREGKKTFQGRDESGHIPPGQVRSSIAHPEERVSGDKGFLFLPVEADRSRGVAGRVENGQLRMEIGERGIERLYRERLRSGTNTEQTVLGWHVLYHRDVGFVHPDGRGPLCGRPSGSPKVVQMAVRGDYGQLNFARRA